MSKKLYSLTNPQKSIWLTEQFYKGTSIENITGSVMLSQNVDFDALKKAINLFVKKNDSFRLKFTVENGTVMQYIEPFAEFDIEIVEVSSDKDIKNWESEHLSYLSTVPEVFDVLHYVTILDLKKK